MEKQQNKYEECGNYAETKQASLFRRLSYFLKVKSKAIINGNEREITWFGGVRVDFFVDLGLDQKGQLIET